jgi:hypothetical protein
MPKQAQDQYPPDEAEKRLQMALRGARITGHKPMSEMKVGKSAKRNFGKVAKRTKAKSRTP